MAPIKAFPWLIALPVFLAACSETELPYQTRLSYPSSTDSTIVRRVQIALQDRGYYRGLLDGFLGQDTANAIEMFQVDHCMRAIPVVDRPLLVSLGLAGHRYISQEQTRNRVQ
jgi:peptidoglycan hydrolase-like protein with peptidoglycan-binding domain